MDRLYNYYLRYGNKLPADFGIVINSEMDEEESEQIPFPKSDLLELMAGIYEQSPRLSENIAPYGWVQSPYGRLYTDALEERYSLFREGRALDYLIFRHQYPAKKYHHRAWQSLSEFRKSYFPSNENPILETFALTIQILIDLNTLSGIIHRINKVKCTIEFKHVDDVLEEFIINVGSDSIYTDKKVSLLDLRTTRAITDIYPFYEVIFRALKAQGHRWKYLDGDLSTIAFLHDQYKELSLGIASPYSADTPESTLETITNILRKCKADHVDPLDVAGIFKEIEKRKTPEDVLAFLHVYGDLPEGYPMRLEDYWF